MPGWILGAAVVAGGLGMVSAPAQAAEFGVYERGPAAYVPPCPGAGYVWVAGYRANGYWVPGRWNYAGFREREHFYRYEHERAIDGRYDRNRFARDRAYDRFRR
jgi:hypothetical protein